MLWGVDIPHEIATGRQFCLRVDFRDPDQAVQAIVRLKDQWQVKAVLALDDAGSLIAAEASDMLGLPHNAPSAALAARDKHVMRQRLKAGGVPCPGFVTYPLD